MIDPKKVSKSRALAYRQVVKMLALLLSMRVSRKKGYSEVSQGRLLHFCDMQEINGRNTCRWTSFFGKSMSCWNVLWSVQCNFDRSGSAQTLTRATRGEIERVLKLLLTKSAPSDDKLHSYERTIHQAMLKRLHFRKDVLGRNWFKDHIREAFDAWSDKTETISQ